MCDDDIAKERYEQGILERELSKDDEIDRDEEC